MVKILKFFRLTAHIFRCITANGLPHLDSRFTLSLPFCEKHKGGKLL